MNVALPDVRNSVNGWHAIAAVIDHTLLKPEATREEVTRLCEEALRYEFFSVMVNPDLLAHAKSVVRGARVKVGTTIGFPLGATLTTVKLFEAAEALKLGAQELDMVIPIGAVKAGERHLIQAEIRSLAQLAHDGGAILKVIIETAFLSDKEKIFACALAMEGGADFVKTSTGFSKAGATASDVHLMRGVVGTKLGVKAAGGIRTLADAEAMLEAGANRIGSSASVAIVRELGAPE
ncbi:deoxyribose-phosphate aldolase [Candidatus Korobacter versatilis]|nr:deoxyribose-phosphate aldolase [Candidatus Koribacter versatilis]